MSKQSEKISFREALRLTVRGFKLWWEINPRLIISITLSAVVNGFAPYVGIYLGARIINELAGARNVHTLTVLAAAAVLSAAVLALASAGLRRWYNVQFANIRYAIDKVCVDKFLSLDFLAADAPHTHDLMSRIHQNDMMGGWGLRRVIAFNGYQQIMKAVVTIIGAAVLVVPLFTLRVPESGGQLTVLNSAAFVALLFAAMLGLTFLASAFASKANSYRVKAANETRFGNRVHSFFGYSMGAREKALDARMYRQDKLTVNQLKRYEGFDTKSNWAKFSRGRAGVAAAASGGVSQIFTGLAYMFVCLKALGGAFGVGSVTQYIGAITALSGGIYALVVSIGILRNNAVFLRTTYEFLDIPNEMYQGSLTTEKRSDKKYDIEFRNVSFKYPGSENFSLRNVSLKFTIGERLAVVGMNGSGKTTFIKLLCRLYDPTSGEILLNGINIRKYDYAEYMDIFSVVFQDFQLLAAPLGQNVAAKINYDAKNARASLNGAGFGERLAEWDAGLETYLYKNFDEHGVTVSGGEAQKIALARALYKDAAFIILDEPTASLDPIAEFEVYNRMNDIVGDKTAVFISHRLSSCRFCQNIAVFHEGEIVQRGSHDELVADEKGKYYELWNAQAQYYTA